MIDENPCKRIKSPAKSHSDVNALQLEDVQKIITKLPKYHDQRARMFILLVLNTGIREGEAAGLEWQDIDYDKHLISIKPIIGILSYAITA
ncbi:tyrosine-type recombinase/integrase [Butyrivibrio sp. AE2032]|uniref:tyrosine-type recombinase/integrase n=1 Tax=Butyrivibrio sp. AE2032 TaxID=1458463 RepID=UPI002100D8DD|nr:tyrosine-type recombinase/integrase [Butyrivibrio sp. AE2032]